MTLSPEAQDLLFREARTANTFTDEPVTDEQVAAIYDLVKYAPTAMNTQPLRILLVRDGEPRERLLKHMADGNRDKTANAPLVAVLAADTDFHDHLAPDLPALPGRPRRASPTTPRASRPRSSTPPCRSATSCSASAPRAWPPARWAASTPPGSTRSSSPAATSSRLLVVNLGQPAENAWFDRLPRLDHDEVVLDA